MKRIERYGLPLLTPYGWGIVGRVLVVIGLVGLVTLQLGAVKHSLIPTGKPVGLQ